MASSFVTATAVRTMSARAKLQRSQRVNSMVQFSENLWTKLSRVQPMDQDQDQTDTRKTDINRYTCLSCFATNFLPYGCP